MLGDKKEAKLAGEGVMVGGEQKEMKLAAEIINICTLSRVSVEQ